MDKQGVRQKIADFMGVLAARGILGAVSTATQEDFKLALDGFFEDEARKERAAVADAPTLDSISAGEYVRMVEGLDDDSFFADQTKLEEQLMKEQAEKYKYDRDYVPVNVGTPWGHGWVGAFRQLTGKVHKQAVDKGWWDKPGEAVLMIGTKLFLSVGELAEGFEEIRKKKRPNEVYWKVDENGQLKPEGFPIELADAVIRICDLAAWCGVDLAGAIRIKMSFNASRPFRHGGKAA